MADGGASEDGVMPTDAILAAYRARRHRDGKDGGADEPPSPPESTEEPAAAPPPQQADSPPPAAPPAAPEAAPEVAASPEPTAEPTPDPPAGPAAAAPPADPVQASDPPVPPAQPAAAADAESEVLAALEAARARKASQMGVAPAATSPANPAVASTAAPSAPASPAAPPPPAAAPAPPPAAPAQPTATPAVAPNAPAADRQSAPVEGSPAEPAAATGLAARTVQQAEAAKAAEAQFALTATSSLIDLGAEMEADRLVSPVGNEWGRIGGLGGVFLGFCIALFDLQIVRQGLPKSNVMGTGVELWMIGLIIILLGAAAFATFLFVPHEPRLGVDLAASQAEQQASVVDQMKMQRFLTYIGPGAIGAGAFLCMIGLAVASDAWLGLVLGIGTLLFAAGLVVAAASILREKDMRLLYVQTQILAFLERRRLVGAAASGPGSNDERVAPVLRALDAMLGDLPDASIQDFMATEAAAQYLELLDELNDD